MNWLFAAPAWACVLTMSLIMDPVAVVEPWPYHPTECPCDVCVGDY